MSVLDGLEFPQSLKAVADLEDFLKCSQCNGDPVDPKLLRRCGHTLCSMCAAGFSGGTCPIPGCGKYSQRKELIDDRNTVVRWDAAQRLKRLLAKDYSVEKENRMTNGKAARDVWHPSPSKEVPAPPKEVVSTDKAAAYRSPSQKEDLFQDTDEEVYAVAEESVKILEESRKETSMVLQELQADWASQNTKEEEDSKNKEKRKGAGRKKGNRFFNSKETASPVPVQQQRGGLHKKPEKAPKLESKRVSKSNPTESTLEPMADAPRDAFQGSRNSRGNGATTAKKPAAPTPKSVAALNKRNMKGETLLHRACIKGNVGKVRELLESGATPNTQDNAGWTPLHEAAQKGFTDVARLLLEKGANPNVPGGDESVTPLHDACHAGCVNMIILLVRFGARKDAVDRKGFVPRKYTSTNAVLAALDSAECPMSDSQVLETSIANVAASQDKGPVSIVLARDLNGEQVTVAKQESKLGLRMEANVTEDVTHYVVKESPERVVEKADLNYYVALVTGKWIVSFKWFLDSVKSGSLIDEEEYQMRGIKASPCGGPDRARFNSLQQLPRLFKGCNMYLHGKFASPPYLDRAHIYEILRAADATILKREPDPEAPYVDHDAGPYHAARDSALAKCSHFIIYQEGAETEPKIKYNMRHIRSLPAAWLFECLNNHQLVEPFN